MISNIYLFCLIGFLLFQPINSSSYRRFRRQIKLAQNNRLSHDPRLIQMKTPSGSIGGTAYYGIASDPNYGSYVARPNRPGGSIEAISYDHNSQEFQHLLKPSHGDHQYLSHGLYQYNYNNLAQRPHVENSNYQQYKPIRPSNQGWYAAQNAYPNQRWSGNQNSFWYNQGQSVIAHPSFILIILTILIFV